MEPASGPTTSSQPPSAPAPPATNTTPMRSAPWTRSTSCNETRAYAAACDDAPWRAQGLGDDSVLNPDLVITSADDRDLEDAPTSSDDDEDATNINFKPLVLHACSGPDRPTSYSAYLRELGIRCVDYDILVDPMRDLVDDQAWSILKHRVDHDELAGMQAGPVCTTYSGIRGAAGGPPPLRGADSKTIYGLPNITVEQKAQVARDTLIAVRIA